MGLRNKPRLWYRGGNVVRVRQRLKTKLKYFLFILILHPDQFKPKSYLKLIKKCIFPKVNPLTYTSVCLTEYT